MKQIFLFTLMSLMNLFCHAQVINSIMERNPSIYFDLYTDEDIYSHELVLLFPDSSFYYEAVAPMMLRYTMGRFTGHGDSLYLTSYQKLDTLVIIKVEEYWNPATAYSTIVVFNESNNIDDSRFLINGTLDTLWSDSNWILKYDGKVDEIKLSVADMKHFSRYFVRSPRSNVFLIQVDSEGKHAYAGGIDIILENALFVKRGQFLYDYSCDYCKRKLTRKETIPSHAELRPYRNNEWQADNNKN